MSELLSDVKDPSLSDEVREVNPEVLVRSLSTETVEVMDNAEARRRAARRTSRSTVGESGWTRQAG